METFKDYLTVKAAAHFLGVSPPTIRNWERAGKLPGFRHPMNGFRLFKKTDLEAVLRELQRSALRSSDGNSS